VAPGKFNSFLTVGRGDGLKSRKRPARRRQAQRGGRGWASRQAYGVQAERVKRSRSSSSRTQEWSAPLAQRNYYKSCQRPRKLAIGAINDIAKSISYVLSTPANGSTSPASPAAPFDCLIRREARIVQLELVGKIGGAMRTGRPCEPSNRVDDRSQLVFRLP